MNESAQQTIILASSSPARKMLLERLGLAFSIMPPDVDESPLPDESVTEMVLRLAVDKGKKVASHAPPALIIASDQMGVVNGVIIGKPLSHDNAVAQLQLSRGKILTFYTSLYCLNTITLDSRLTLHRYDVHFRDYSDDEIFGYLRKENPYGCAGSFKSEGLGIALVEKFEGDDPNSLTGLPLIQLVKNLTELGCSPLVN